MIITCQNGCLQGSLSQESIVHLFSVKNQFFGEFNRLCMIAEVNLTFYLIMSMKFSSFFLTNPKSITVMCFNSLRFLTEAGITEYLKQSELPNESVCDLSKQKVETQLKVQDLEITFVIVFIGFLVSLTALLFEIVRSSTVARVY